MKQVLRRLTILVTAVSVVGAAFGADGAERYITRLTERVAQWREELPALMETAQSAAKGVLAGGNLYITGPQLSFPPEGMGRSGGLMMMKKYDAKVGLSERDTIIAAMTGAEDDEALGALEDAIERAEAAGAAVVLFAGAARERIGKLPALSTLPRKPFEEGETYSELSIESVSNVIALWTWTGQFVSACVAEGRMPCMYESYYLPGGRERGEALKAQNKVRFHDVTDVTPKDAVGLGGRYLDAVGEALEKVWRHDQEAFERAVALIRQSRDGGQVVRVFHIGHMFPDEIEVAQSPPWLRSAKSGEASEPGGAAILLQYQSFPRALVGEIAKGGAACILSCSHAPPAEFTHDPRNVYINPFWEIYDAGVELAGYDVRILPMSGVMHSTIYWQLVEMGSGD